MPILLICRVFQGVGGGGLQPMAQAIMADSFEEKKRGQAFALYGLVAVLAPSIGPTIGGWITDNYSWRWIFYINIPVGILALVLTTRLVQDPPWIKADRKNLFNLDYIGLGLLTVAMGGLQIMLDKGEENDWFASNFIRTFGIMFVVGMIGLVWWELAEEQPPHEPAPVQVQELRHLLPADDAGRRRAERRNRAAAAVPATAAGLHRDQRRHGPHGRRHRPGDRDAHGRRRHRQDSPHATSLRLASASSPSRTTTSPPTSRSDMSFGEASFLRVIQMIPIPFCFISITNAAYVGLPREASNQVSGLINFVRNVGGSIFIAVTGAMVTNRSLFHQARLVRPHAAGKHAVRAANPVDRQLPRGLRPGQTWPRAKKPAQAMIYNQLNQQASAMGYQDIYRALCWMSIGMVLCAFLLSKNRPGEGAPAGEAVH